jgi:ATP-dependent DNA helicase RecG
VSDSRNPDTVSRLQMLCSSNDGFEIAEYDLRTRGPGNFLGHQQHGLPQLRIADLTEDLDLVRDAQAAATQLLSVDPMLEHPESASLRHAVEQLMGQVGERPN